MARDWSITSRPFQEGRSDILLYTLKYGDFQVEVTNFGATITSVFVPDKNGTVADVVLGFDTLTPYMDGTSPYFGAIVGRVANRIANGRFTLHGVNYSLPINNGPNSLHGGNRGYDKVVWTAEEVGNVDYPSLKLSYLSPDGEEGYPGDAEVTVVYSVTAPGELQTEMRATTSKSTPFSVANHSYWNLAGHASGDILGHVICIHGSHYTPVDATLIPTGDIVPVSGTPFDFLTEETIGRRIGEVPGGYDHNYVLDVDGPGEPTPSLRTAARVTDPGSGRVMELLTTAPGMQFYTANFVNCSRGKGSAAYRKHAALCLETQGFPNAVNELRFPSVILNPGEEYRHVMVHRFSTP